MQMTLNSMIGCRMKMPPLPLTKLNKCLIDVQKWIALCKLKLNPDKTKFIVFWIKFSKEQAKEALLVALISS